MKKLFIIGFCALSLGAQAHSKKANIKKVKKKACTETVTVNGTESYYCSYTKTWSYETVYVTASATEADCTAATNEAIVIADEGLSSAESEAFNELANKCIPE